MGQRLLLLLLTAFFFAIGLPVRADSHQESKFMIVMGDSVTLGVWADTKLGSPQATFYLEVLRMQLHAALLAFFTGQRVDDATNVKRYAEVIDRNFFYIQKRHLSALIGDQPYALPKLMEHESGAKVEVFAATVLAGCYQLSQMLFDKIEVFYRDHPGHKNPDYVFINFNAMDFMFNTPNEIFADQVKNLFHNVADRFPETTVVVTPLIDIVSVMKTSFDKLTIPGRFGFPPMYCADSYKKVGFGNLVGLNSATSDAEIEEKRSKLKFMQDIIDAELLSLDERSSDDDSYRKFSGKVIKVDSFLPPGGLWYPYLAVDCIHPNMEGQRLMGYQIWQAIQDQGGI